MDQLMCKTYIRPVTNEHMSSEVWISDEDKNKNKRKVDY